MRKSRNSIFGGIALAISLLSFAVAQQDEADKVPQYKTESAGHSSDIGNQVYFVASDPLFAVFNVTDTAGEVRFTSPEEGKYVVKSMKLKYTGDDGTGFYYQYQNDVPAGGLVWFLPKAKRGYVYWMYGGTASPQIIPYGPSVRFSPK